MKPRFNPLFFFLLIFLFFFLSRSWIHFNLKTEFYDQYFYDNPLWNTSQGRPLLQTIDKTSFLAGHFSPVLFVFALPYFIFPSALWMFAFQALFVAGGGALILSFAQKHLNREEAGLILLLLLMNAPFRYTGLNDFHMDAVLTFLLTAALYLFFTRNNILIPSLLLLSGFLVKEIAGLVIASFGLFLLFFRKEKIAGALLFILGIAGLVFLIEKVIPQFNPAGAYAFTGYFSHFGNNTLEQISNMLLNPLLTVKSILTAANILYLFLLLAPMGFLPCFAPKILFFGALPLLENLLSNYRFHKDLTVQYSSVLIPTLFFAAIFGIKHLRESGRWQKSKNWIMPTVYFFAGISVLAFVLLQLRLCIPSARTFSAHKLFKEIPKQSSVSASNHLLLHLQYRERLKLFPDYRGADYVIFEEVAAPDPLYLQAVKNLASDKEYKLADSENGIVLYKKLKAPHEQ